MPSLLRRSFVPVAPVAALAIGLTCAVVTPPVLAQATATATSATATATAVAKPALPKVKVKAAFVDVERCVGETEDGLRAKATLKKVSDRKQMYVSQVEEGLKRQQDELAALAKDGQTSALSQKVLKYQGDLQRYNDLIKRINNDLAILEDDLLAPIEKKVKAIFTRIAEEKGFDVIFDKKLLLVNTHPELDLTEQVIREYNWGNGAGAGGIGAPATGSAVPAGSAPPTASAKPSSSPTTPKPFVAPF
ncbi:MAG: OmpH family outer membrane protein [Polyangiales bacterium]